MRITSAGIVVFGNGLSSATPEAATLQSTNGLGTNINGATLSLRGGRGTGSGAGGSIVFSTSPSGTSGSTLNAPEERMVITSAGNVGIGTNSPTNPLDVNADSVRIRTAQTPATSGAAGNQGEIAWDANYIYVCTATNTWKRVAIATW
jgi:hypothetical protein